VTETTLKFATVVTPDVPSADADAMFTALERYLLHKNNLAKEFARDPRKARMAEAMLISREAAYKQISLSRWILQGPQGTWRAQLDEYYRKEPVFALVGGISGGSWQPIHQFSEEQRIPCLLPLTDYPAITDRDWYTLYFSKGLYQEGEAAARYLHNQRRESAAGATVLQLVRSAKVEQTVATGFTQTWQEMGNQPAITILIDEQQPLSGERLKALLAKHQPQELLLWGNAADLAALDSLADSPVRPQMVLVAAGSLGPALATLPERARAYTYITYPWRLPQDEKAYTAYAEPMIKAMQVRDERQQIIVKQAYAINQVLSLALMELKGNYTRDSLLDVIGMGMNSGGMGVQMEQTFPIYERLSFGPGQRYASKGCYIVQLSKGEKPELIKRSDWVIH
jgi:hypothetical protein